MSGRLFKPNLFGTLPTNVPDRVVTWGRFKLPRRFIVSPVLDWHSGFPFSIYDDLQNYVGPPNSRRFPTFVSLDMHVSKDFRISFIPWVRKHTLRGSVRIFNVTNHGNYRDVYNIVRRPTSATTPASSIASSTYPWMFCIELRIAACRPQSL